MDIIITLTLIIDKFAFKCYYSAKLFKANKLLLSPDFHCLLYYSLNFKKLLVKSRKLFKKWSLKSYDS